MTPVAFDAANPAISIAAMVQHGAIVAPVYIVGSPGGMPHADTARVAALRAAGLAPLPNWERAADFFAHCTVAEARAAGVEALTACRDLGFPDDGSVDVAFSFDYDMTTASYPAALAKLLAVGQGLAGHYRAIAYGEYGFLAYLAAHGQPGPHWLMASTFAASSQFTGEQVNAPFVGLVQSHDAHGNWINTPIPGTDINTVTNPATLRAWWPDGSPYGGDMPLDPKDPVIVALNAKIDRNQAQINGWFGLVVHGDASHPNSQDAQAIHIQAVSTALAKLSISGVDPVALAQAIAEHITLAAK